MTTEMRLLLGVPADEWRKVAESDSIWTTLSNIKAFEQKVAMYTERAMYREANEAIEVMRILQEVIC